MLWFRKKASKFQPKVFVYKTSTGMDFDKECFDNTETDINTAVPWFLMSSKANTDHDPILSTIGHRNLCKKLVKRFDDITHRHKDLLTKDDVSREIYNGEYPKGMENYLNDLRKDFAFKHTRNGNH